jgi:hypothetical protein
MHQTGACGRRQLQALLPVVLLLLLLLCHAQQVHQRHQQPPQAAAPATACQHRSSHLLHLPLPPLAPA